MNSLSSRPALDPLIDISVKLASPERIRSWSAGKVWRPETFEEKTGEPVLGGIFCDQSFGSEGDQMGHIELRSPVVHTWYLAGRDSLIGKLLDLNPGELEQIIYHDKFVVVDPCETDLQRGQLLAEEEIGQLHKKHGDCSFAAETGSLAIRELLCSEFLPEMIERLRAEHANTRSKRIRERTARRIHLVEGIANSGIRPEWMVLDVLPVLPPTLRPHGESDLNELYLEVLACNERLRSTEADRDAETKTVREKRRRLQEAVDALFNNCGRKKVRGNGNRILKSLTKRLENGPLQKPLPAECAAFSGCSNVVPDPSLKPDQCGIPRNLALMLFEPFVIRWLIQAGMAESPSVARRLVGERTIEVLDAVEHVARSQSVLVSGSAAPGQPVVMGVRPFCVDGDAIRIHPVLGHRFGISFGGEEELTLHVPVSGNAGSEIAALLPMNMLLSNSSQPTVELVSSEAILGAYILSRPAEEAAVEVRVSVFGNGQDVEYALSQGAIQLHTPIRFRNPDLGHGASPNGDSEMRLIDTTPGRILFNNVWPNGMGFINSQVEKSKLLKILKRCIRKSGIQAAAESLRKLTELGCEIVTRFGISPGVYDAVVPARKAKLIENAFVAVSKVNQQYERGILCENERYHKVIDTWVIAKNDISREIGSPANHRTDGNAISPFFAMVDSGLLKSSFFQGACGMTGPIAGCNGRCFSTPIISSLREGFQPHEVFISAFDARKWKAEDLERYETALLLRRELLGALHDFVVTEEDCGTDRGITLPNCSPDPVRHPLAEVEGTYPRTYGRISAATVIDPYSLEVIVEKDMVIGMAAAEKLELGCMVNNCPVRSVLTCQAQRGCCKRCYGLDPATGEFPQIGDRVGLKAAFAFELSPEFPARILWMNADGGFIHEGISRLRELFTTHRPENSAILAKMDGTTRVRRLVNGMREITVVNAEGWEVEHRIPNNKYLLFAEGSEVVAGDKLTEGESHLPDLLSITGFDKAREHFVREARKVYLVRGKEIADLSIEIVLRQMLQMITVRESGDSPFLAGDIVEQSRVMEVNDRLIPNGLRPAAMEPTLLGIDKLRRLKSSLLWRVKAEGVAKALSRAAIGAKYNIG